LKILAEKFDDPGVPREIVYKSQLFVDSFMMMKIQTVDEKLD